MTIYWERWQGMLFPLVAKLSNHNLLLKGAEKAMSCIYTSWGALQFICEVRLASSWNVIWEITGSVLPSGCKAMKALMRDKGKRIWSLKNMSFRLNTRKNKAQRRALRGKGVEKQRERKIKRHCRGSIAVCWSACCWAWKWEEMSSLRFLCTESLNVDESVSLLWGQLWGSCCLVVQCRCRTVAEQDCFLLFADQQLLLELFDYFF